MLQSDKQTLQGIYPMLYAFWTAQGTLDQEAMTLQVEYAISSGADGIAVLGLVTESHRMDGAERLALTRMVGRILAGRLPYSVTVAGHSMDEQIAFAHAAVAAGADWLILQPPNHQKLSEDALIDWFVTVGETITCPLGIQNNPEHLINALSAEGLLRLSERMPSFTVLKGEGPVVGVEPLIARTHSSLATFGGHGGIEHISLLQAGAVGLIPAPDCLPLQVRIHRLWQNGDVESRRQAVAIQAEILPLIVFMNRSLDGLLCYGRQFMARRLGLSATFDRFGTQLPTVFGLQQIDAFFAALAKSEADWLS
ncbi:hypothetical protein VW29_04010 [Devosia limi DSM 17137]|uniref:4-hydroxy-tetrahydrodipicolinate synthase n=2 Tax=Devosia TaxID=46913 RepID=A0A0F5LUM9_9HYPH|nr:hypothetical protein VW29_04010 [Devosia limi DSM 17137]SHF83821.1 4-hydroxy-tetrahydrodipicolinate synthase [Devosia limi DSM 17137]